MSPLILQDTQVAFGDLHRLAFAAEIEPRQFSRRADGGGVDDPRLELLLGMPGQVEQADQDLTVALSEVEFQDTPLLQICWPLNARPGERRFTFSENVLRPE